MWVVHTLLLVIFVSTLARAGNSCLPAHQRQTTDALGQFLAGQNRSFYTLFFPAGELVPTGVVNSIGCNMASSNDPAQLKAKRGHVKGQLTRLISTIDKMMANYDNADEVKAKLLDFDNLVEDFVVASTAYASVLTSDSERCAAEEYRLTVEEDIQRFRDAAGAWLVDADEQLDRVYVEAQDGAETIPDVTVEEDMQSLLNTEKLALETEVKRLRDARRELEQLRHRAELDIQRERAGNARQPFMHSTPSGPTGDVFDNERKYMNAQAAERTDNSRLSWGASRVDPMTQTLKEVFQQVLEESRSQSQTMVDSIHLPKTELIHYDGNPLTYYPFLRSFENTVGNKSSDDSTKLNTLLQYCTGPVEKLLQCCLVKEPSEGYRLAMRLLKDRFGDKDRIAQTWISKILDRPKVSTGGLLDFVDDLRCGSETLKSLGYLNELENGRSLCQILEKLPSFLQSRWLRINRRIKDSEGRNPKLVDIIEFISDSVREVSDPVFGKALSPKDYQDRKPQNKKRTAGSFSIQTGATSPGHSNSPSQPVKTHSQVMNTSPHTKKPLTQTTTHPKQMHSGGPSKPYEPCYHCDGAHYLVQCQTFKALRIKDRIAFVQSKKLCVNCFKPGHIGRECPRNFVCPIDGCGRKHSKFLHLPRGPDSRVLDSSLASTSDPLVSSHFIRARNGKVALPIVAARVRGQDFDTFVDTYALVDPGGTGAHCSAQLAEQLGLVGKKTTFTLTTIAQKDVPTTAEVVKLQVSDLEDTQVFNMPYVMVSPSLNIGLDNLARLDELNKWPHLADIKLPPSLDANEVHLLIGQDTPDLLCPIEVRTGQQGEPYATRTTLGWAINGPIDSNQKKPSPARSHFINTSSPSEVDLIEKLWRLDDTPGDDPPMSINDHKVLSIWDESAVLDDGRYKMDIPFKTRPPNLPNNRLVAEHRLRLLGKRLQKDCALKEKYTEEIHKLLDKQYAEVVPPEELSRCDGCVYYLPHHPVLNPRKPDKCRIVFDCAAKYSGTSLNDHVHQGPDLTNKLLGVLIRFRQGPVAFMADIEAMFHQVQVNPQDRDVLRFLWWENDDPSQQSIALRMNAHLFGGVWSPSCANYALRKVVQDNCTDFDEETLKTVTSNFYVDDCLKSLWTTEQAINLAHQLKLLLLRGGFNLTKWISNSRELMRSIPESQLAKGVHSLDLDLDQLPSERALGLLWNTETDCFQFEIGISQKPSTRRGLLSIVSSVYDPLGFVSPFILGGKRLFQELCRQGLGWDDPMPQEIEEQWGRWLADLPTLKSLHIPRCLQPPDFDIATAQLHHFADASEYAYGAVSYIRLVSSSGQVHCTFMLSKARLAPLKSTTIPRLELAAAVEAVKLDQTLQRELQIPILDSVFWSDSMIVMWYLQNEEKRFQTYVANRVSLIREHSTPQQWRHIPSELNPADDASRGLSAQEIVQTPRWIQGPEFLFEPPRAWPQQPDFKCSDLEAKAEIKHSPKAYTTVPTVDTIGQLLQQYSSWYRLKKAVAWILRFKNHLMGQTSTGNLSLTEVQEAEQAILAHVQKNMSPEDNNLKKLMPYRSQEGILCVGGRLSKSSLPADSKHPWILPTHHHVTTLIIRHYHTLTGHAGSERILADTREKYWIIKGRVAVRKVLSRCITCKKLRARPEPQLMADLPPDRLTPAPPFSRVGIDYFGPFMVKRARSELKRYGCVFTCLVTRAIHIEVAQSMDTDAFINALQRFIARRGEPRLIRSDNGTNFVGAQLELQRALKEWNQAKIQDFLHQRDIEWVFNPPAASHMGGVWERQIRTIRNILRGLANQQMLDDEALTTLMCLAESIVNSRPITKVSDDARDPTPLTPNHLLLLRSGPTLPPGLFVKQDMYKRRWRQVQYLADIFWKRWLAEYLPALQERQKWLVPKRNLQKGDLVMILYENTPRQQWPLGLIVHTHPGSDGYVRSVSVKTQSGIYDRPVDKICLLEGTMEYPVEEC